MVKGVDCAARLTAQNAAALRAEGYAFVGRYLVPTAGSTAWKALSAAEARAILQAGLRLLCVWETAADRAAAGAQAGAADGAAACALAEALGMPAGTTVYFAVDYEATDRELDAIEAYLRAAGARLGDYSLGVYGSFRVVETMAARGVCRGFWQCRAWSYGQVSAACTVYQHTAEATAAGLQVDLNDCPDMDRAGMWGPKKQEEQDMTQEQWNVFYDAKQKELEAAAASDWSKAGRDFCTAAGLIRGAGGTSDYQWKAPVTREALAVLLQRLAEYLKTT